MSHRELTTHLRRRNIYKQRKSIATSDGTAVDLCAVEYNNLQSNNEDKCVVNPTEVAVQILDEYGCLMIVNSSWLLATRYRREEVIGHWFGEYLVTYDKSQFSSILLNVRKSGQRCNIILRMLRDDMSIIFVRCNIAIIYDEYGIHRKYYCTLEDITNYILVNGELENGNDYLQLSCTIVKHD